VIFQHSIVNKSLRLPWGWKRLYEQLSEGNAFDPAHQRYNISSNYCSF